MHRAPQGVHWRSRFTFFFAWFFEIILPCSNPDIKLPKIAQDFYGVSQNNQKMEMYYLKKDHGIFPPVFITCVPSH